MPNRHRLPYAAFGGYLAVFLGVSLALAQEPQKVVPPVLKSQPKTESGQQTGKGEAADQGQKKEPTPEKLSPSLNRIESAIRDLIAQQRAAQGKGPEQHEISDLKAQEGMAFWAKTMFWATVAAVALTFIGILLIKRTLEETKRAAIAAEGMLDEAKETTKAAQHAVEVTSKTAERQLRAYVFIKDSRRTRMKDTDPWVIEVHIKNFGQTPAYRAEIRSVVKIMDSANETTFGFPLPERGNSQFDLAPGHEHTLRKKIPELAGHVWDDFRAGRVAIYLWGRVDFIDAFDEHRWMSFRHVQPSGGVLNLFNCTEGNETSESQNF